MVVTFFSSFIKRTCLLNTYCVLHIRHGLDTKIKQMALPSNGSQLFIAKVAKEMHKSETKKSL